MEKTNRKIQILQKIYDGKCHIFIVLLPLNKKVTQALNIE